MSDPLPEFRNIKTLAFVGPAGTGKSQRAQMVAYRFGADYIIDDGLVIRRTEIVAGKSAKTEKNQIRAIRRAMFEYDDHREAVQSFFRHVPPCTVLVIATSDGMALKITQALGFSDPSRMINISEFATADEMAKARRERKKKGQHVIPVSHVQVRKNFAGKLVGRIRLLWKSQGPYDGEKTIVRPPFSFYGDVHIEPMALEALARYIASKIAQVRKVVSVTVSMSEGDALKVSMELTMEMGGSPITKVARSVREAVSKSIASLSGLDVASVSVNVVGVEFKDE